MGHAVHGASSVGRLDKGTVHLRACSTLLPLLRQPNPAVSASRLLDENSQYVSVFLSHSLSPAKRFN